MHIRRLPTLLAFASLLAAQDPILLGGIPGNGPKADATFSPNHRELAEELSATGFAKLLSLRLSGLEVPDVLGLGNDGPVLLSAPGVHQSTGYLPGVDGFLTGVRDAAVLVDAGNGPRLDALALSADQGTFLYSRDFATGGGLFLPVTGWSTMNLLAADPSLPEALFGVDQTGTLRRAGLVGGLWSHAANLGSFPGATALAVVDWDGGTPEVAVLTPSTLWIVRQNGSIAHQTAATAAAGQRLCPVHGPNGSWLAWLVPGTSNSALHTLRTGFQQTTTLPGKFVGLTAKSMDFDGFDDLLLSNETNDDATLLFNQAWQNLPPFHYHIAFGIRISVAASDSSRPANHSNVAAADLDADGDVDVLAMVAGSEADAAHILLQTTRFYDLPPFEPLSFADYQVEGEEGETSVFTFTYPAVAGPGMHTQVLVWKETSTTAGWAAGWSPEVQLVENDKEEMELELRLDRQHLLDGGLYHVLVRPVIVDAGAITQVGEAFLGIIYTEVAKARAELEGGGEGEGVRVGGIVTSGPLPPTPPGNPPVGGETAGGGG